MVLEKHKKYKDKYGSNELFWGIGIEIETYLQFDKDINVAIPILKSAHKPERYSVDYYKSYNFTAFHNLFFEPFYKVPYLINSHSLSKVDRFGIHATTYERVPKPNKKFSGQTLFDEIKEFSDIIKNDYELRYTFDGDSIEFMTLDFYKAKLTKVIKELVSYKATFLKELNRFLVEKKLFRDKGLLIYPPRNPGFAMMYSNPGNIVMFNNGTYHINITIPSLLGADSILVNEDLFREEHRLCIQMIQWMEPFLLGVYGTADPFSSVSPFFSKGSQRCSISRYIGIGTFDVDKMEEGKIMTRDIKKIIGSSLDYWWYRVYHAKSAYKSLDQIGMDINYRKHYNHGIEIRIFDWFPEDQLKKLVTFLIHLCDLSLKRTEPGIAVLSKTWNMLVVGVLREGGAFQLTDEITAIYERVLGIPMLGKKMCVTEAFEYIFKELKRKEKGRCATYML